MISEALKYVKSLKIEDYELFYSESDITNLFLSKSKIDFASQGNSSGLGVRVFVDGKLGFSSTNNVLNYKSCVDTAVKIAKLSEKDSKFKSFLKEKGKTNVKGYDKKLLDFTLEDAKSYIDEYIVDLNELNKEIRIPEGHYQKVLFNTSIVNSEGIDVSMLNVSNSSNFDLMIDKDIVIGASRHEKLPLDVGFVKEDVKRLLSLRNRQHVETKTMQLIFHPEALAEVMETAFVYALNGENVNLKKSVLFDKLNKKIFDKKVSIVDDGTIKNYLNTAPYDSEGKVTTKNVIIKDGILKGFLYDSYNAYYANRKSTGNCSRGYSTSPGIGVNNFTMKPGNSKDMINQAKEAVYVRCLIGTHTMDTTTGNFSLGIGEGYYIKDGEIKSAIKDAMIAGNFFKIMNEIIGIGKKIENANGFYLPELMFKEVKVVGK